MANCTISSNSAVTGGGIDLTAGTLTVTSTIVAGNQANTSPDIYSSISYSGNNNLIAGNPLLTALGNYGGPTQTMALLPGSPALGGGTPGTLNTDQRGLPCTVNGCTDTGAFESQGFTLTVSSGNTQTTTVATAFSQSLVVTVTSSDGTPVAGGQIVFTAPSSGASAALTSSPATIGSNNTATVTATANQTAGTYNVTASETGTGASCHFQLTNIPGAVSQLSYSQQPSDVTAGAAISPAVQVQLFDTYGNLETIDSSDQVTIAVASGPGSLTGSSTTTATVSSGVATFSNLVLTTVGPYTLKATVSGLSGLTSSTFTVNPTTANQLFLSVLPSNATAGSAISPAVQVQVLDMYENLVSTDNSDLVGMAVASGPGSWASGSTTSVTVSNGVAIFSNLVLDTVGTYTLSAAATGLGSVISNFFTVSAASASRLSFLVQPSNVSAGSALSPAVQVQLLDQYGNPVNTDNSDQVKMTAGGPGSLAGSSATKVTSANGVAVFSNLVLDTAGTYTLSAAATGFSGTTSATFTVGPASASNLAFVVQPGNGTAGSALSPTIQLQVLDTYGNLVNTDNSDQVSMAVASGPGTLTGSSATKVTVEQRRGSLQQPGAGHRRHLHSQGQCHRPQ